MGVQVLKESHGRITIMKFGGSSVMDSTRIKCVARIIKDWYEKGRKPVVVVSAMGKTTDNLIQAGVDTLHTGKVYISKIEDIHRNAMEVLQIKDIVGKEVEDLLAMLKNILEGIRLIRDISVRTKDILISFGERLSVRILAGYLKKLGLPARAYDAWDIGMKTKGDAGDREGYELHDDSYEAIGATLGDLYTGNRSIPIVTGFLARDEAGRISNLGRGGSDYSASIIGAALGAREIEIWTDVDGIQTCDPRLVSNVRSIDCLSFDEASEMAYFGAKVLHPSTLFPAVELGIPVRVLNSYNPTHPGTVLVKDLDRKNEYLALALSYKKNVTMVDLRSLRLLGSHGFHARVFSLFDEFAISVDVIATSEVSVSLTLDPNTSQTLVTTFAKKLENVADITIKEGLAIVAVIGNVARSAEIVATVCTTLHKAKIPVEMISCGASKVNINIVVPGDLVSDAIQSLHDAFFPSQ